MKILKDILLANAITFAVVSAILIAQSFMGIDNYFNLMLTLPIVLISLLLYWLVDKIERKINQEMTPRFKEQYSKLTPFEVIVDFGAFKGMVRPVSTNRIHLWVHVIDSNDNTVASVRLQNLEPELRKTVEELLEAQEGER